MNSSEQNSIDKKEAEQDATLAELIQKFAGAMADSEISAASGSLRQNRATPDNDPLSSLLSNPEMIAKLPQMISALKPIIESLGSRHMQNTNTPANESETTHSISTSAKDVDSRSALLCALKPYLSRDRQNAIDYIIKLSKLGDILKTL